MKLVGSNENAAVAGVEKLAGVSNYYIGNDPSKWRTGVPTYSKVRFADVYPGVDLLYYGNQGRLEHDFIVAPGADPAAIAMQVEGELQAELGAGGDLNMQTEAGEVSLLKPTVYQIIGDQQKRIEARYILAKQHEVRFFIGEYDRAQSLIIDPVLQYSTLLSGSSLDYAYAIAVNSTGEAYVGGQTYSTDFPIKNPVVANNPTSGDNWTDFVTKVNAAGTGLVYSTYLGGSGESNGDSIAVDSSGAAYLAMLSPLDRKSTRLNSSH